VIGAVQAELEAKGLGAAVAVADEYFQYPRWLIDNHPSYRSTGRIGLEN
jgi:hypothetical protein